MIKAQISRRAQGRLPSTAAAHTDLERLTGLKESASSFKGKGGKPAQNFETRGKKKREKKERDGAAGGARRRKWLPSEASICEFTQVKILFVTFDVASSGGEGTKTGKVDFSGIDTLLESFSFFLLSLYLRTSVRTLCSLCATALCLKVFSNQAAVQLSLKVEFN